MDKAYPKHTSKIDLKDLAERGFEIQPYVQACRDNDEDLITLRHPLNYVSEVECEVYSHHIMNQVSVVAFWLNRILDKREEDNVETTNEIISQTTN